MRGLAQPCLYERLNLLCMTMEAAALSLAAQVKALVPDHIFKRAKELASSNKLHSISFQGPLLHKSVATCAGSNPGDNYNLSILIDAELPSKPMCQCSCPAQAKGNLCKHVVALLLLRTEELAKGAKEQSNASILSEFKLAEDRLAGDKQKKPTLSDSQATEEFVPSDDNPKVADEETNATAQSVSPVMKNNQKRVLPSWISEGFCAPKKGAKEKKVIKKTSDKQDTDEEEEAKMGTALESHRITQLRGGKGKNRAVIKGATKKPPLRKWKDVEEETDDSIADSDGEDSSGKRQPNLSSRAGRGTRRRNADATVKKGGRPAPKRRRTRGCVESDLSEEEEPEVLDSKSPSESKEDLDLTTEDLVNLANEHLEMEKSNVEPGQYQPDENAVNDAPSNDVAAPKKKGSIFSVQGWNEIAVKSLDAKDASFSQEPSDMPVLPSTFVGELQKSKSQASAELGPNSLEIFFGGNAEGANSLEPAENVVDDMLGLFFGPTLSKTVTSKVESTQDFVEDVTTGSMAPLPETDMPDVILPQSVDAVPKPKKKGSLKDTVMKYLG